MEQKENKERTVKKLIILLFVLALPAMAEAASYNKASMYNQHGLSAEAKKELINLIYSKTTTVEKAKAHYLLGTIAFNENNVRVALKTWKDLVRKYPNSQEATLVKDRIKELSDIVGDIKADTLKNALAQTYLRHGDFWTKNKASRFTIDSSWLPKVEMALKWYDKVIAKFPKTDAARVAYESKLMTLLGWKDRGRNATSYGVRKSLTEYMPQLLETFAAFEKDHPDASSLQAYRYQIAQAYWDNKDWDKTREWLNTVITKAGDADSFYKDAAQRRLEKVVY